MAAVNVTFPGNLAQVKTAADLRSVPSTLLPLGALFLVNGLEGLFEYDPGSLAPDDGKDVLRPVDKTPGQVGLWIRNVDGLATGPEGPTGPANSTYTSRRKLEQAPVTNRSYNFAPDSDDTSGWVAGAYFFTPGDFSGAQYAADFVSGQKVKLDTVPLTTGALVRQAATGVNFDGRSTDAKLRETVSVKDTRFAGGAKGDGAYDATADTVTGTDDTAALNAAINAGFVVDVPPGVYRITGRIVCTTSGSGLRLAKGAWIIGNPWTYAGAQEPFGALILFGKGIDRVSVTGGGKKTCGVVVTGTSEAIGVAFLHCSNVKAVGFSVIKGSTPDTAITDDTFQTGLSVLNSTSPGSNPNMTPSNALIEDIECANFAHYGFQFYGNIAGGTVRSCTFRNNGRAAQVKSRGCGMAITRGVNGVVIEDCDLNDNVDAGILGSSAGENSYDIKIERNRFVNNGRGGLSWTEEPNLASVANQGTFNLAIRHNSFINNGNGTFTTGKAAVRIGTYDGVGFIRAFDVSHNIFDANVGYDMLYQGNPVEANALRDGVTQGNQMREFAGTTFNLGIGANVLRLRHINKYDGNPAKFIDDNQANFTAATMQNTWGNAYGPPFKPTGYMTSPSGEVIIDYQLSGTNVQTPAFTLPAGSRPQYAVPIPNGQVNPDGTFVINSGTAPYVGQVRFFPYAK